MNRERTKNIKGTTLLEIVIVLAVVSIMSTMTVTFSLMCGSWMNRGVAQNDLFSDIHVLENLLKNTLNDCDNEQTVFGFDSDKGLVIMQTDHSGQHFYYTSFKKRESIRNAGEFIANSPVLNADGQSGITYAVKNIESIDFEVIENEQTHKALVICDITYNLPANGDYISDTKGTYRIMYAARAAKYYTEVVAP